MLDEEQLAVVSERLQSGKPAVVTLPEIPANLEGSLLFKVPVRYGGRLLAPHLLGYMDGDGLHGLTGVELAFDEYLNSCGGQASRHLFGGCHGQASAGDRAPGGQHPG